MAKKDYSALADAIIEKVGGKANISYLTHCYTRLRMNLKDRALAKEEEIKSIPGVLGAQWMGDQLQIIIGQDVADVYNMACKKTGLIGGSPINENLDAGLIGKQPFSFKELGTKFMDGIVGCVIPVLPILVASGLTKALLLILQQFGLVSADSPTTQTLTFVADTALYFLPVFLGGFTAKKFGGNTALGAMLGAVLLHPSFVAMVGAGTPISVFGIPVYAATYSSSVLPAIISVWVMCYVEKFIAKHSPTMVRSILEPLLTMLIMVPVTLCALAPIGSILSDWFAVGLTWCYDKANVVTLVVLCALVPFIVMFGIHMSATAISIQIMTTIGKDCLIMPSFFLSNFTQGAACLAVGIKAKDPDIKALAFSSAFSDIVPHISEPGMYGITLRYKTPMIGAMIGAAVGGLYFGLTKVGGLTGMPPSLFAFAAYIGEPYNLMNAVIGVLLGMAVAFVATLVLYKETPEKK